MIASFQGQPPNHLSNGKFQVTEQSAGSHIKHVTSESDHVAFKGTLNTKNRAGGGRNKLSKYAVGVIDGDGMIWVHESFVVDFKLVPKILAAKKDSDDDDKGSSDDEESKQAAAVVPRLTGMAARNLLGETFGSRKKKQEIKALERNKINVSDLKASASFISSAIDEKAVNIPTEEMLEEERMEDSIVPPFNLEAEAKHDMYPMDKFIPFRERESILIGNLLQLSHEAKQSLINDKSYPAFVAIRLSQTLVRDQGVDEDRIKQLLYLSYLIQFRNLKESDLNRPAQLSSKVSHIPQVIIESFFAKFTEQFSQGKGGKPK